MVLPFVAIAFAVWAVADIASYAMTGEDTAFHFANWMGWTNGGVVGEDLIIVTGSTFGDFVVTNWIFISILLAVVFCVLWFTTRPLKGVRT